VLVRRWLLLRSNNFNQNLLCTYPASSKKDWKKFLKQIRREQLIPQMSIVVCFQFNVVSPHKPFAGIAQANCMLAMCEPSEFGHLLSGFKALSAPWQLIIIHVCEK
jgi:hypothetical protein